MNKIRSVSLLLVVMLASFASARTNSVNLLVNGDLEGGSAGWDSEPTDTPNVCHSPTHTFYWSATHWKKFKSRTTAIDSSKTYDFSCWVASSNRVYNTSMSTCSIGLEFYDSTGTNLLSSQNFFNLGRDIGFTAAGVFEGFQFYEVENIEVPAGAEYACVVKTYAKATDGKIWLDDFYLGEYHPPLTVVIIK